MMIRTATNPLPLCLLALTGLLTTQASLADGCDCDGATDRFCDPDLEYPRCWDCEDVVRYRHAEAIAAVGFRDGVCSCREDGDCLESEYCNLLPTDNEFCTQCDAKDPATNGFCESCYECHTRLKHQASHGGGENILTCPSHCHCQSSNDCPGNHYCAASDNVGSPFEGGNVCRPCHDCINERLAHPEESCPWICPDQVRCTSHEECTETPGQWCDKERQCNNCSSYCFEESYYKDLSTFALGDDCPDSCCGFGMDGSELTDGYSSYGSQYVDWGVQFRMRPCDQALDIRGYVMKGLHPNVTALEMAQKGQGCLREVQVRSSYTEIQCPIVEKTCSTGDYTIALVVKDGEGTARYLDEDLYPYARSFTNRYDSCHLYDVQRTFMYTGIVVGALALLCLFGCCYLCRQKQN